MVLVSDNVVIVQLGGDNGARGKGKRPSFHIYIYIYNSIRALIYFIITSDFLHMYLLIYMT